ncbi:MAG: tetraacyldisaccharide 4'-kinase [Anaerolineae bacterium]|nr:tetraacyldisaccharide 4'-kinase [Gemmatimonadaceae bacterium]
MPAMSLIEGIWRGEGTLLLTTRRLLTPLSILYRLGISGRNALYDAGILRSVTPVIPAISVGNLSVGGTGKTPVSSWIASRLRDRGAHPAIVLRGYGDDEPLVHRRLQPDVPVIASPNRVDGIERAALQGADLVVLDDAFQHRRVRRVADVVLISADQWTGSALPLPAGPWREPLSALKRATLIVITRKAVTDAACDSTRSAIHDSAPGLPIAILSLELGEIQRVDSSSPADVSELRGTSVLAIAAVADPRAFALQLERAGASVRSASYPDHHPFDRAEAERLAASLRENERAICTLKDAVKLAPLWPRAASPLWYVSQRVIPGDGVEYLDAIFDAALNARTTQRPSPIGPAESRHGD